MSQRAASSTSTKVATRQTAGKAGPVGAGNSTWQLWLIPELHTHTAHIRNAHGPGSCWQPGTQTTCGCAANQQYPLRFCEEGRKGPGLPVTHFVCRTAHHTTGAKECVRPSPANNIRRHFLATVHQAQHHLLPITRSILTIDTSTSWTRIHTQQMPTCMRTERNPCTGLPVRQPKPCAGHAGRHVKY